jgi:membrane protease YdiL (CAAX protease family)
MESGSTTFYRAAWQRVPTIARAIITGLLVSSIGVFAWYALLSLLPAPWSILFMIPMLWIYLRYFSGSIGTLSTRERRKILFRNTVLSPAAWKWGMTAAVLFVLFIQSSFVVTFRLVPFPSSRFMADYRELERMPAWSAWSLLIMGSIVAGICEETGFRGYMQGGMEKKYGPWTAIVITSIVFTLIHLSHSWAAPIFPHIFFASVLLGVLAWKTQSLIPGIIGHSILDIFDYSVWWTGLTGGFTRKTIFITGTDLHFLIWLLLFLFSIFGFILAIRKLEMRN